MGLQADSTEAYSGGVLVQAGAVPRRPRFSSILRREARLAYAILTPTLLVILFLVAYPFFAAIYLSLQNKMVGAPGRFVGLSNYVELLRDEVFLRTAWNSVVYTLVAVTLKFFIGFTMALILDQERRFNNFFRTLLFMPWAVPVVIVALNWRWIYDDLSGFLNNFVITVHITSDIISWLSNPGLAMGCVIAVVVWAGTPFWTGKPAFKHFIRMAETGVPVSYAGSPTPAAGEVLNTQVIPKMIQRVLVENWEPARALDECHRRIAEIYTRNLKGR